MSNGQKAKRGAARQALQSTDFQRQGQISGPLRCAAYGAYTLARELSPTLDAGRNQRRPCILSASPLLE